MTRDKGKKENTDHTEEVNVETPDNKEGTSAEMEETEQQKNDNKEAQDEDVEKEVELSEVDQLKADLVESKDKYLRLYSEFENFRRRSAKEKLDLVQSANQELVGDLLPVLDDLERALLNSKDVDKSDSLKEGMELIYNKFKRILEQKGVKVMDIKEGSEFDPEIHEAITQIPAPKDNLKGKIVDVIEKGYYLHEKVVRFAKVVVGS